MNIPVYAQFPNQPQGLTYLGHAPDINGARLQRHERIARLHEVAKLVGLDPQWVLNGFVATTRNPNAVHMPAGMPERYWRLCSIQMPDTHGQRQRKR